MEWVYFGDWYRINKAGIVESNFSGQWKEKKRKKSKTDNHGGFYITVSIGRTHFRVHLLMWERWKGPRRKGYVINHIDGDRENCALDNLEEITQKQNIDNLITRGKFKLFGKPYERRTDTIERDNQKPILFLVGEQPSEGYEVGSCPEYLDCGQL